mgnify:FL=1
MENRILKKISESYDIEKKFMNLLNMNYILNTHHMNDIEFISIGSTLLYSTKNFSKTMLFLDRVDQRYTWIILRDMYNEWNRLQHQVFANKEEKELYDEDMYLFIGEIEDTFGQQFIDFVLTFFKNFQLYVNIKNYIMSER